MDLGVIHPPMTSMAALQRIIRDAELDCEMRSPATERGRRRCCHNTTLGKDGLQDTNPMPF